MVLPETWDTGGCVSIRELGKHRVPIRELAKRVWKEIDRDNVTGLAAQTSYYFVLALFPFLIFLAAVVGSLPFTGLWDEVLSWVTLNLPRESQHLIFQAVASLTRGRGSFLSIGLLGTAWAASSGFMNLMGSLNAAYEVTETRSFSKRLGLAFVMLFVVTLLCVGSFGLLSAGDELGTWLVNRIGPSLLVITLWFVGRWVLSLVLMALAVAIVDHALPNLRRPWYCFTPGTLFVVLTWVPATLGFNVYVHHFGSYSKTYGALGAFVILMIWTYITSLIVLIGAEINCELHKMRAEARLRLQWQSGSEKGKKPGPASVLVILSLVGFFPLRLRAQQTQQMTYEGAKVAYVDLVARPGTKLDALRPLILQKAGEPYSNEKVQSSVAALKQTGGFSKVDVEVTPETAGLRVAFVAQPAFYVGMIYFPGAVKVFSYPRLLQVVNYPAQEPYEERRVRDAEPNLRRFFADNGYFRAQVQSETRLDEAHRLANLVFHVTLNTRAKFGRVEVTGPPRKEAARLEQALSSFRARLKGASLKSGKPYDPKRLEAGTKFVRDYLGKENRLASQVRLKEPRYDPETNRADVTFEVTLGPTVVVRVAGARLSSRTLRRLIPIYEENAFDQDLVAEGQRNLISYFQSKGYFDVKVNLQTEDEPSDVSVLYRIEKGNKHRVMSVKTAGNHKFDDDDLKDQVVVKKGGSFSRGKFSQDLVKRSVDNVTAFYRDAGFADVKVQPEVIDHEPEIYVTFKIAEGEQTLVDSLQVEGNTTQTAAALAPEGLKLRPGQPYSLSRLDQDRNQIVANYMNRGYLSVDFKSTANPLSDNSHRVAVTYVIQEGPRVKITDVAYLGARHTRQSFIQHNTSVRPGASLSEGKLLESESKLYNLGILDWANVAPRRPITDQKQEDVLVKVHEAKRNSLSYGVGFQSTAKSGSLSSGVVALPGLPTVSLPPNFTIIEKTIISPLGSLEYSRLNLRGRGETASIATLLSRLDQKASFTYTDPQFRGLDWSALWSLAAERTTQNPLFTARFGSGSFQVEKVLDAAKTKRLQLRYTFQRTALSNLLIQDFVLPEDMNVASSTLSASFLRDTRDKPLDAHKGVFQTLDFGVSPTAIGSTYDVVRFFGQTAFYRQVKPWMVWANNFRLGLTKAFAGSHVPISELFFSGGADSLRGYPLNGAGPQGVATLCTSATDLSTCTAKITVPEGGRMLFIFNSEGRFPIPLKKGLGGVIFYDGGNVYRAINMSHFFSDYSNTVGVGLRYQTPVGPLRIDIGQNLNPVPGLKSTHIFVTLGQSF